MKIRPTQIASEQVRLLLFKECDWRGRKLLFDSSTIEKVATRKHDKLSVRKNEFPCIVEMFDGWSYVYKGPASDSNLLGEMIFGAVAMNYKGVSLKIHIMDEPRRLMCTKVFCVPASRRISRGERKTGEANTPGELYNSSTPWNVPSKNEEGMTLSFSLDRGDSGFYGDNSPYSSVSSTYEYFTMFDVYDGSNSQDDLFSFHSSPGRKLSCTSNSSWQRRTFQNLLTRFDLGHHGSSALNVPTATSNISSCDSQLYSNSSASGTCDSFITNSSGSPPKKNKLGLALLITVADSDEMDVVRRCVEHSPQLQALVCRLRLAALSAGGAGNGFVATLHRATADAAQWLSDLMHGPRLQPIWLNLATSEDPRTGSKIAETLLSDLCSILSIGDTKHTNFFVSTLLTYVLTYHLGWVTTVSPYDIVEPQKSTKSCCEVQKPYNALWAQLSDLCGTIGSPPRAARTVICGSTNTNFINRLLVVLTYFLRCGDVKRIDFEYQDFVLNESEVVCVENASSKRTAPCVDSQDSHVRLPLINTQNVDSNSTLKSSEVSLKKSMTLANLNGRLSIETEFTLGDGSSACENPMNSFSRNPKESKKSSSESSLQSSVSELDTEQKVVFVLGDDDKLVGLKNKSVDGKSVKKSSKIHNEPVNVEMPERATDICTKENCKKIPHSTCSENPTKCCRQILQHSKPIKHSGFKFEFDKYPQIVTNYMKSKNLEILDRHYIGKPGNLKLDNFQFDPTIVPPIQEERCEICYKCQMMEATLQTPTNASELEYMNDVPRQSEPQYAKETIAETIPKISPKNFIRKREENTLVVNVVTLDQNISKPSTSLQVKTRKDDTIDRESEKAGLVEVRKIVEFPLFRQLESSLTEHKSGFDRSLLGGVTDHYIPDLILQGTTARPDNWETDLRRDLDLMSYLNKNVYSPLQAVAIIGDINTWEVRVAGRSCSAGGMSALVAAMLDALPAMWRARVPPHQCLTFLEGKLREFCVLSKTLADILMSTDFCDIATLTKSLNIDVNDVPFLLAVATTHTPQVAMKYGISYR